MCERVREGENKRERGGKQCDKQSLFMCSQVCKLSKSARHNDSNIVESYGKNGQYCLLSLRYALVSVKCTLYWTVFSPQVNGNEPFDRQLINALSVHISLSTCWLLESQHATMMRKHKQWRVYRSCRHIDNVFQL